MNVSVMARDEADAPGAPPRDVALIVTAPDGPDHPITYASAGVSELTGHPPATLIGDSWGVLTGPDTDPAQIDRISEALSRFEEVELTLMGYRRDGSSFPNRITIAPLQDSDGTPTAFLWVLRRDRSTSTSSNTSKVDPGQMLEELQHRVKNHLAMIVSMIRMQAKAQPSPTAFRALSHRIETLALLYDQMSATENAALSQELDLARYLERVVRAIEGIEGRPGIEVVVLAEPLRMQARRCARVGLILSELLTNALKHAFAGRSTGRVSIPVEPLSGGYLRLTVEDAGIGLRNQGDWPASRGSGGLGGRILTGLIDDLDGKIEAGTALRGTRMAVDIPPETDA